MDTGYWVLGTGYCTYGQRNLSRNVCIGVYGHDGWDGICVGGGGGGEKVLNLV